MNSSETFRVLAKNGMLGYSGPGWSTKKSILSFMRKYPRGKGIPAWNKSKTELYEACLIVAKEWSRTKSYI